MSKDQINRLHHTAALVDPYKNLQAALRQTSNRIFLTNDPKEKEFLLDAKTGSHDNVRSERSKQPKIVILKGVNDCGIFELDSQDEHYLPFEGTGAVSDWELDMSHCVPSVLDEISDVIINLKYTALAE